jgi:hypothetical protein
LFQGIEQLANKDAAVNRTNNDTRNLPAVSLLIV